MVEILPRVCDVPYYARIPNFLFSSAKNVNEYSTIIYYMWWAGCCCFFSRPVWRASLQFSVVGVSGDLILRKEKMRNYQKRANLIKKKHNKKREQYNKRVFQKEKKCPKRTMTTTHQVCLRPWTLEREPSIFSLDNCQVDCFIYLYSIFMFYFLLPG